MNQFKGPISQIPPVYSAIKVNGQRAYKLAREGKEVIMQARQVTVNSLEVVEYQYPEVKLLTNVSSGTYIRTLVEDIALAAGSVAYTTQLTRTTIGEFSLESACEVADLTAEVIYNNLNLKITT